MSYILSNSTAILLATLSGMAVGIAYSALPGRPLRGASMTLRLLAIAFAAEFWLSAILAGALILAPPQANPWVMALASALVIWIGFVLPTVLVTQSFRGERIGATVGDCVHWLLAMLVQAAVLHAVGLAAPTPAG